MAVFEIPLRAGSAQRLTVELAGTFYDLTLAYIDEDEGGWVLDIAAAGGPALVCGIPLLPGQDLLEPYAHLSIGVRLAVYTAGDQSMRPTFSGLGVESRLLFEPLT